MSFIERHQNRPKEITVKISDFESGVIANALKYYAEKQEKVSKKPENKNLLGDLQFITKTCKDLEKFFRKAINAAK